MFARIQDSFAAALLDAGKPVPAGVTSHTAKVPAKRFAVYRNNVVAGLVSALKRRFSAVERIVGEEFFAAMARVFVTAHPPRSAMLMVYGDGFPDFIAKFAPAVKLPYLADVARLESARTRAYHAADAAPIEPSLLPSLDPNALEGLRVIPHPSAVIVRSPFPVVTIWGMNAGEMPLRPIEDEDWRAQDALVVRPRLEVEVRTLPPGGAAFLASLFAGKRLAAAVESAFGECADFDLAANLAGLVGSGAATDFFLSTSMKDESP
jgi:hypothetical protein